MIELKNAREADALVRALDGIPDDATVRLTREDSIGNEWPDGFLIVEVRSNTYNARDAISELGTTASWGPVTA